MPSCTHDVRVPPVSTRTLPICSPRVPAVSPGTPTPLTPQLSPELMVPSAAPPQPRGRPHHFVLRDTEQRGLCLRGGRLVPTPLQGASADLEERMSAVPNPHLERRRCPLIVGIRGGSRALSCSPGPEPRLQLEDVALLELFSRGEGALPYTFYKTFGGSTHTFEAAACPGAFLSTAGGRSWAWPPPTAPRASTCTAGDPRRGHGGARGGAPADPPGQ
ncbi:interleukin-1 family member 10-like [Guaruba guarouba]